MKRIGFVVNPIAGIGGRVALKGSDGLVKKAMELGGIPLSPKKAEIFVKNCKKLLEKFEILTVSDKMGEDYLKKFSLNYKVVYSPKKKETSAEDTKNACKIFSKNSVDLVIFVGGDGTARDIINSLNKNIPILGIPGGVKVYSAVFALNPEYACSILSDYLEGNFRIEDREIVDIDEEAFRRNELRIKIYGYWKTVVSKDYIQQAKSPSFANDETKEEIAEYFVENIMEKDTYYILGPGTTVKTICKILNVDCTLLGVDILFNKKIIKKDCMENDLLEIISSGKGVYVVVSPLGAQNTLFGRGNQQISPKILKKVGKENIIVLSTPEKLTTGKIYVDTGDEEIDKSLRGYIKVLMGYGRWKIVKIF